MRAIRFAVVVSVSCLIAVAVSVGSASATDWRHESRPTHQGTTPVRINQIQVVGSHNSYHLEANAQEQAFRTSTDPVGEKALEYGHPSLTNQFTNESVRQIELDVFADPNGGLYAHPLIRDVLKEGAYNTAMNAPGIKVLHIQDIDYGSNCLTLNRCLQEVKAWSDAHPSHVPIPIIVQLSDSPVVIPNAPYQFTQPIKWDATQMNTLDTQIKRVFQPCDLITPDDVRGNHSTLPAAITTDGWPTLAQSRGKVMFLMDNAGAYRTTYLQGHPSLQGRMLFTNSTPGQPDAAFIEENDPTGTNFARIQQEVQAGYIVRTRADVDTVQARTGDTTMRDAAFASGAQMVSTDYPIAGIASRFGTNYVAQLPNGVAARCNPVSGSTQCPSTRVIPGA